MIYTEIERFLSFKLFKRIKVAFGFLQRTEKIQKHAGTCSFLHRMQDIKYFKLTLRSRYEVTGCVSCVPHVVVTATVVECGCDLSAFL